MVPKKRDSMVSVLCLLCLIFSVREREREREKCLEAKKVKETVMSEGFFFSMFFFFLKLFYF